MEASESRIERIAHQVEPRHETHSEIHFADVYLNIDHGEDDAISQAATRGCGCSAIPRENPAENLSHGSSS
jgi:hypothetical protein